MVFYKVKEQYDGKRGIALIDTKGREYSEGRIVNKNELFTDRELDLYRVPKKYCKKVNINKYETFFYRDSRYDANEYETFTVLARIGGKCERI